MGPAHAPLPGVQLHLFTFGPQPKMEVRLTPDRLSPHLPHTPLSHLFLLKVCVPIVRGSVESGPALSSALQMPGFLLQAVWSVGLTGTQWGVPGAGR